MDLENKEDKNEDETNINHNQVTSINQPIEVDDDKVEEVQMVKTPAKRLRSKKTTKKEAKQEHLE